MNNLIIDAINNKKTAKVVLKGLEHIEPAIYDFSDYRHTANFLITTHREFSRVKYFEVIE